MAETISMTNLEELINITKVTITTNCAMRGFWINYTSPTGTVETVQGINISEDTIQLLDGTMTTDEFEEEVLSGIPSWEYPMEDEG